jgi:hypothetical protein
MVSKITVILKMQKLYYYLDKLVKCVVTAQEFKKNNRHNNN